MNPSDGGRKRKNSKDSEQQPKRRRIIPTPVIGDEATLLTARRLIASQPTGALSPIMQCVYDSTVKDPLRFPLSTAEAEAQERLSRFLDLWYSPDRATRGVYRELDQMDEEGKAIVEQALEEFEEEDTRGPFLSDLADEREDDQEFPPLSVDFLDIGMGSSTLFVCADGTTVLIDCGCHSSGSSVPAKDGLTFLKNRLEELQRARDLKAPTIDRIYITHADQDHYNLFPSLFHLMPNLAVGEFHIGGAKSDYKVKRDVFEVKKSTKQELPSMSKIFTRAKVIEYPADFPGESKPSLVTQDMGAGTQTSFQVMGANAVPQHGETDKNASSIVVMVEKKSSDADAPPLKLLMMGDGEQTVEEKLVQRHKDVVTDVDFLHIGHHGAELAGTAPFLKVANPRVAQLSADQVWAHPYRSTVERITDNPKLRVNEAKENDKKRSIIIGESLGGKHKQHQEKQTTSAILMNVVKQTEDTSNSEKAKKAKKDGATPMEATGQQWNVIFRHDNSFTLKSTLDDQNDDTEFL